jgi:putative DNA primase/helicase
MTKHTRHGSNGQTALALPEFLDDWLVISGDSEITRAIAKVGEFGLLADTWSADKAARKPNVKAKLIIVAGASAGPGRKLAVKIAKECRKAGAKCVREWPLAGLGESAFPDFTAWSSCFDLEEDLRQRRPWMALYPDEPEPEPPALAVDGGFNLTELGNAQRLVKLFGDRIRYCWTWRAWFIWDGTRWRRDETGEIFNLAKTAIRGISAEASQCDDEAQRKALLSWALKSEGKKLIEHMVFLAQSEPGIAVKTDEWDRHGWLFNVQNGTIDLRTGKLKKADPKDCITKICAIAFDPDAACPLWDQTLKLFFQGNEQLIAYFQEICGYAMVGEVRDHVLPICHGLGQNGKSTILGALLETFGPDFAMKCPPEMLMAKGYDSHPTDRADLFGKRLVVAIETESGRRLNETLVKELTGGDRIRARRMREDFWEFPPTHTVMMGTNHKPVVRGTDHAIWRRLKLVPFLVTVDGKQDDTAMPHKLKSERAGILAWCVRGCLRWQQQGLSEPTEVTDATKAYRAEQDVLGSFLTEYTLQDNSVRCKCGELYAKYKKWAEDGSEHVLTMTAFGTAMQERGFKTHKISVKWYLGIALRQSADEEKAF